MKHPESSAASTIGSKSMTDAVSVEYRKSLLQGSSTILDSIFPLVDQYTKQTKFPVIFPFIVMIVCVSQVCMVSFWRISGFWSNTNDKISVYVNKVIAIAMNSDDSVDTYDLLYRFLVLLVGFVVIFSVLLSQIIYYQKSHRFISWSLFPTRLLVDFCAPMLINPAAAFVGQSIRAVIITKNQNFWLFAIFGAIFMGGFIFSFLSSYILSSRSAFIQINSMSMFDTSFILSLMASTTGFIFLSYIFSLFSKWNILILQATHLILFASLIPSLFELPFHKLGSNSFFASCVISSVLLDAFFIVNFLKPISIYWAPIAIFVFTFIVSVIVFQSLFSKKYQKIATDLSSQLESDDNAKFDYFKSLGLEQDESLINSYMRVGFAEGSRLFIDWSLIRYVVQLHLSDITMTNCIYFLSFFPSESRKLNGIFSTFISRRNLSFTERFQAYQVYRIKILRQSSVSSDANDKIIELKSKNSECESMCRSFWKMQQIPLSFLDDYSKLCADTKSLWVEAIRDFPNNIRFHDEYCRFLSESLCEFEEAIRMKNRSNSIEVGKNFSVDYSFRSLVRAYPHYLKKRIVDVSGNILVLKSGHHSSSSNDRSDKGSLTNSTGELDAEVEESIGKQLFRHSRMRLALHHAVRDKKTTPAILIPVFAYISLFASIAVFVVIYIVVIDMFTERRSSLHKLSYISYSIFGSVMSSTSLLMNAARNSDRFPDISVISESESADGATSVSYIPFNSSMITTSMQWLKKSRDEFSSLLSEIAEIATNGENVYSIASPLMNENMTIRYCIDTYPTPDTIKSNLKNLIVYIYFLQARLSNNANSVSFFSDDRYCELLLNWKNVISATFSLFDAFSTEQNRKAAELNSTLQQYTIYVPIILGLIFALPIIVFASIYVIQTKRMLNALGILDDSIKNDSSLPVLKDCDPEDIKSMETKAKTPKCVGIFIFMMVIAITVSGAALFILYYSQTENTNVRKLNQWYNYASKRFTSAATVLHDTLLLILLNGSLSMPFTSLTTVSTSAWNAMLELEDMNNVLLHGDNTSDPCYGYDSVLDAINLNETCQTQTVIENQHDIYKCRSATDNIAVLKGMVSEIVKMPTKYGGRYTDSDVLHVIHLTNSHLFPYLDAAASRIYTLCDVTCNRLESTVLLMVIAGMIVSVAFIVLGHVFSSHMMSSFKVVMTMIKRVSPISFINNKELVDIFLNRSSSREQHSETFSGNVIQKSPDAIFFTGLNSVIEMVNPATSVTLGYSPEQLLGKPISSFFTNDDSEKLNQQLSLMRAGQSASVYESRMICVSDNTSEIPCHITILGMKDGGSQVSSFVFIVRDETELVKQQEEAEKAKARSESLLYQILPPDIVIRLNQGEKDISFSVASASIIFIDIVKFSSYASTLTPYETMTNLFTIFSAFDQLASKHPLITKIKLIGDVYMAASGLFAPDMAPERHAEEIVKFGLDVLSELEELNIKLNSNLSVRIGINSGGPLIAGVLGTDRPVFDIIGDPINVAARLQSTDIPGRIQISQSTYDLIKELNFQVEQRGEVFLKGKGQTMTYFVSPLNNLMTFLSSSE